MDLTFDSQGLIPAVVQEAASGKVLMVAWMNAEAVRRTRQSGEVYFWSRSRGELWHKGETSGNTLYVREVRVDCDGDTLLLQVDPTLDPDGVRSILARTARSDDNTGTDLPNHTWGHGKIDAYEAVALAMGVGVCTDDADCADGWTCMDAGRCEEKSESGCGCGQTNPTPGRVIFALSILLLLGRRRGA